MNNQLIFDTAVKGILAQNALSKVIYVDDVEESCVYFDEATGNRCAIGHLVTDQQALRLEDMLGGACASSAVNSYPDYFTDIGIDVMSIETTRFLNQLQQVHDNATDIEHFRARATQFAQENELNTFVLETKDA